MALQNFFNTLNKSLDDDKKKMSYESIKELFFEDQFIERYKQKHLEIIFEYVHKGGGKFNKITHEEFLVQSDNDKYNTKISELHSAIYKLSREVELQPKRINIISKYVIFPNINDTYILHKHSLKKIPDYFNLKRGNVFINELTKVKSDNIIIYINLLFKEINDNMDIIIDYITNIIKNLNNGGSIILFSQLLLSNNKYYDFFIELCSKFKKNSIAFSLHPLRQSLFCEIKFENYNVTINNNIDIEKLIKFYKEMNKFVLEESDINLNLIKVKYHDQFMYELIYNKLFL